MCASIFFWVATLGHLFPYFLYSTTGEHKAAFYYSISIFTATISFLATTGLAVQGYLPPIEVFQISKHLGIAFNADNITLVFALMCSLLSIPAVSYAIGYMYATRASRKATFFAHIHLSLAITMLLAFSENLLTLFIFYELLTLSTYTLVKHENTNDALRAARIYLTYLILPSMTLLLPAILITYHLTGSLSFNESLHVTISGISRLGLFLLFAYGTAKTALFPLHGWLPRAMIAPTPVSALLHSVAVVKAGIFCMVKVVAYIFTTADSANEILFGPLNWIYGFTVIFASVIALKKASLKEILAYSTISQLAYVGITLIMFNESALGYALTYMVLHAFAKITLFFTVGAIYAKTGRTALTQLYGIGRYMPTTMLAFTVGAFAIIGLPPTATLLCKANILSVALHQNNYFLILTFIASTALNCGYFLPIIFNAFFNKPITPFSPGNTLPKTITLAYLFSGGICITLFIYQFF